MKDIIIDTLIDSLKLLPFLFFAFLLIELFEHKLSNKTKKVVEKSGKFGPLFGSLFGAIPQCGFSVAATNLYVTRIISLGSLIAIYLSTSDEMIPVLLSENVEISIILKILAIKVCLGMFYGFLIDFLLRKRKKQKESYDLCHDDDCDCENHLLKSTLKHTLKTILFILIISFILNILMEYVGSQFVAKIFLKDSIFSPFISSLIGLIPNCGASIIITELYLNNAITMATAIGGLLTNSGVALLVLFRENKNIKENITILLLLYFIGVISGIVLHLIGLV